jgi:hypothetical protein
VSRQAGLGAWAPPPPPRKATQVGLGLRAERTPPRGAPAPAELPKGVPALEWGPARPQAPAQLGLDIEPQRDLFGRVSS